MKVECPMGHYENLSYQELANRLSEGDFECRSDGCSKSVSFGVDERFWHEYVEAVSIRNTVDGGA